MITKLMKDDDFNKIKSNSFTCLFIKANGCHHCEDAAPIVEELSNKIPEVTFYSATLGDFPEIIPFYEQFAEQEQTYEFVIDDKGNPVTNSQGQNQVRFFFNDDGSPRMRAKIAFPTFLMFHESERDEDDNEYGFLGRIDGNMPEKLEGVLTSYLKKFNPKQEPKKYDVIGGGLKSLTRIVKNKLKGVDDKVEESVKMNRLAICNSCPKLNKTLTQCDVCKCFLAVKTQYKEESCPEGKW
jgi:thiol-disulfide isomerase/thioredoxin